jgi:hypothetical protein
VIFFRLELARSTDRSCCSSVVAWLWYLWRRGDQSHLMQLEVSRRADRRPSHICDPRSPAPPPITVAPFDGQAPWRRPLFYASYPDAYILAAPDVFDPSSCFALFREQVEFLAAEDEPNLYFAWPPGRARQFADRRDRGADDQGSDLVVVFGSPRVWLFAIAVCFPLHVFEFFAHLIEPLLKSSSFNL